MTSKEPTMPPGSPDRGGFSSSAATAAARPGLLLHLPGDVLALVASKLDRAHHRLALEATSRHLLATSRSTQHGGTWWAGAKLKLSMPSANHSDMDRWRQGEQAHTGRVSAWLAARRPSPAVLAIDGWDSEMEVPAPTLPSQPPLGTGLEGLELSHLIFSRPAWAAVMAHTQLTSLRVASCFFCDVPRRGVTLRTLRALQHLEVSSPSDDEGRPGAPPLCKQLAGCTRLTSLTLELCSLQDLPAGLSTLSVLRQLALRRDVLTAARRWPELTTLRQLSSLDLSLCHLEALPSPLSRCTALESLSLQSNWDLSGDWALLRRLTRLTALNLSYLHMPRLPPVLSALTRLQKLDLSACEKLTAEDEAWQPLAGHPSLRYMEAGRCASLAAVPRQLSTLRALQSLGLFGNRAMAAGGGWEALAQLTGLTMLWLVNCGLPGVPPQLAALSGIIHM